LDFARPSSLRRDVHVIGVVGFAHLMSHFFQLVLPPLFPLIRSEFGTSYAVLGTLVGVYYAASGVTQFLSGFVVDRVGARGVLLSGLALAACGTMLAALAPGVAWLFPIVVVMGIGNGVFHPANFAILNASVAPSRLGHAFSSHGVGGNIGFVLAPMVSFALGAAFGWRVALAGAGAIGLIALGLIASQRALLVSHRATDAHLHTMRGSVHLFAQSPIVLCFLYFVLLTIGTVGTQTFTTSVLESGYGVSLALATSALTAYLLGGTAGILAGGFLASRTRHHHRVAAGGMLFAALALCIVALDAIPAALLLPVFASAGFAIGTTSPSRDMIVREATPKGAEGRVYGFVYSGFDLGGIIGPVAFGVLLDAGLAHDVFFAVAGCFLLSIGTVFGVRRASSKGTSLARPVG